MQKRQKLLQSLLENLSQAMHQIDTEKNFPFGNIILKKQQVLILFFIYNNKKDPLSVKDLAVNLNVTSGAITQFVDELVKKNLVRRERNYKDGRIINILLSNSAEKQFNIFKKKYLKNANQAFKELSDEELIQFLNLVKKVKRPKM